MIPFVAIGPGAIGQAQSDSLGKLSVGFQDDWQLVDGVEDVGWRFGPQRTFPGTAPTAPDFGVKARRGNPDKSDIITATAMGVGVQSTDIVFVVWASTLLDGGDGDRVAPLRDDFVVADDGDYRIVSLRRTVDYSQWRCLCRMSVKE